MINFKCLFCCNLVFLFQNVRKKKYTSREEFLIDVNQMSINSKMYNGKFMVVLVCVVSIESFYSTCFDCSNC